jgi:hypothetical protein
VTNSGNYSLAEEVERALTKAVERRSWARNGKLYMSDLKWSLDPEDGGDCPKKLWAKMRNEPEKAGGPGVELMLHAGDRLHEQIAGWLEEHMKEGWFVEAVEERVKLDGLSGRLDIRLKHKMHMIQAVIDVKTKRGAAFQYLHEPHKADELQVQGYMLAKDADYGLLVYVDREGQNWIKCFVVKRDDEAVKNAIISVKAIKRCAEKGQAVQGMEPQVLRKVNKGPDSVTIKWPWQVTWCPLEHCYCKARVKTTLPKGIVAHILEDDTVRMTEKYSDRDDLKVWIEKKLGVGNVKN